MRIVPTLLTAALVAAPSTALAQSRAALPHFYAGGTLGVAQPTGTFGDHAETGFGGGAHLIYRPDARGIMGLRLDGGFVNYGHEARRVSLDGVGDRVQLRLNTDNNIAFGSIGPQVGMPSGRIRPYANAFVGASYFFTGSSLSGKDQDSGFGNTTNYDDVALSYGIGGGTYVVLKGGRLPVALDLGVRYHRTAPVSYLAKGGITDHPDGSITVSPNRSTTELLSFQVGGTVALGHRDQRRGRGR
jgi:hypothetical protein